jgi:hypothetical protein
MKAVIGPFRTWIGPYQIADAIFLWPDKYVDDEHYTWRHKYAHSVGHWLAETWVADACQKLYDLFPRRVYVRVDKYDAWNADHTISLIALPLLKQLKEQKHGAPHVDDEDVPEHLRSTAAPAKENDWDTDELHFDRWEWVLDEIIWAHYQEVNDDPEEDTCWTHNVPDPNWPYPPEGNSFDRMIASIHCDDAKLKQLQARKQNGFRLFGKYYQALWD